MKTNVIRRSIRLYWPHGCVRQIGVNASSDKISRAHRLRDYWHARIGITNFGKWYINEPARARVRHDRNRLQRYSSNAPLSRGYSGGWLLGETTAGWYGMLIARLSARNNIHLLRVQRSRIVPYFKFPLTIESMVSAVLAHAKRINREIMSRTPCELIIL